MDINLIGIDIKLFGVDKIAPNACNTLTGLIYSVISRRDKTKTVTIYRDYVGFSAGLFAKEEKVYYGSDIECVNRIIQKKDSEQPPFPPKNDTTVLLFNILIKITAGHIGRI